MSTLVEGRSLEAEIAECCQAIYWATEPEVAMKHWARLRDLTAQRAEAERHLFLLENKAHNPIEPLERRAQPA